MKTINWNKCDFRSDWREILGLYDKWISENPNASPAEVNAFCDGMAAMQEYQHGVQRKWMDRLNRKHWWQFWKP